VSEHEPQGQGTTHFGFREVPESEKTRMVGDVFHSVASRYDLMNDLMSLGIHRAWKRFAVDQLDLHRGQAVLDLAGGTGDLTTRIWRRVGRTGRVCLSDINSSMLAEGRARLADAGIAGVEIVQANAEELPFADGEFDAVIIGFGLRNVTHKDAALRAMYRVLKPGGRAVVLEFSRPVLPGLARIYDSYSFNILPLLGRVVAKDEESYRYLAESIRRHPDQETLKDMMSEAGFARSHYFNLSGGIVAVHKGYHL
jgi:demethylmenaquinone methyltransferase/2-methoxy-6-polyprenyl-1,4-benzoquinol methylase